MSERRFGVAGVLIKSPIGFLMQHRDDLPGKIFEPGKVSFFGGAIEPSDSSPRAAAARELREETDIAFDEQDLQLIVELNYRIARAGGGMETLEKYAYLLETEVTSFEVFEGQGLYVLPVDADLNEHNLSANAHAILRVYLEKTKEG